MDPGGETIPARQKANSEKAAVETLKNLPERRRDREKRRSRRTPDPNGRPQMIGLIRLEARWEETVRHKKSRCLLHRRSLVLDDVPPQAENPIKVEQKLYDSKHKPKTNSSGIIEATGEPQNSPPETRWPPEGAAGHQPLPEEQIHAKQARPTSTSERTWQESP